MTGNRSRILILVGATLFGLYAIAIARGSANASNVAQLLGGLAAVISCAWMAWRSRGIERYWRVLTGLGMLGWAIGQAIYSWHRLVAGSQLESPSWADVCYLSLPAFASIALVLLVSDRTARSKTDPETILRRTHASIVVCAVVISGAMFIVTWSTQDANLGLDKGGTIIGIIYLITDIIVLVLAFLFISVWVVSQQFRLQLWILAAALASIGISDGLYAYLISAGLEQMPPSDVGFVMGPFLISVAATIPPQTQ